MTSWSAAAARAATLVLVGVVPTTAPDAADYLVQRGDTLEMTVAGVPELRQRSPVNVDGDVSFPLLGAVKAAGLPLARIRTHVQSSLPGKEFRRLSNDGREYPVIVSADEIDVTIAEYRPVYINGDISKPGEQAYRPGLTVRQAVSLGGGYDILRLRMNNPFLEQADLRGQYHAQWTEFAKEQARVTRLRAELAGKVEFERKSLDEVPVTPNELAAIIENERGLFDVRRADYANEKRYLEKSMQQQAERSSALVNQQRREQEGTEVDTEDLKRLEDALRKGAVALTRVVEGKRMLLYSSTRALQTAVQLAQAQRDGVDAERRLERFDTDRRAQLLAELQDAEVRLAGIRSNLQALSEKLVYTGMVRSQLVTGSAGKPSFVVIRTSSGSAQRMEAEEDTELQPGDVVEVALTVDLVPGQPVRRTY